MDNGASSYRRFLDGDESGLVEIIRDYKDGLIFYLNSFVSNIHTAEELAEDTFVRLGTKKPKDKKTASFKTWLYTIGRNAAIDYLRKSKKRAVVSLGCVCFIVLAGLGIWRSGWLNSEESPSDQNYKSIYIPPATISLSKQDAASMDLSAGIIIYQGKIYFECDFNRNTDIVGEYLGSTIGLIDEWTPSDGYVELAGTSTGPFYAVKGFDPSFMICKKDDLNLIRIFVHNNDLTLTTGADLFDDKLQLKEKLVGASYLSTSDWNKQFTELEIPPIALDDSKRSTLNSFVDALYKAPFIYMEDIPSDGERIASYHLYLETDSGMTIQLYLYDGGYVRYAGLRTVCVKLDEKVFNSMIDLFVS